MTETILTNKKHGMLVLLLTLALYVLAVIGTILFAMEAMVAPMVVCIVYLCLGWIFFLGLKVLAPQGGPGAHPLRQVCGHPEGEGFYYVNPFCVAVNPAAKTQMNQSPDIESAKGGGVLAALAGSSTGLPKGGREQKDLPKNHDPQQRPPKDQRLPGQPRGDRHRRHLAGGGHGEGGFRRGQLQGVPLPPVRRRPAEHRPPLPLRHRPRGRRPPETSTPDEESLPRLQRSGGRPDPGRAPVQGPGGRFRDPPGPHHPPGLCLGDRPRPCSSGGRPPPSSTPGR